MKNRAQIFSSSGFRAQVSGFLLLLLLAVTASAAEVVGEVKVESLSPTSVIVQWRTDVECGTRVTYGAAPNAMLKNAEGGVTADHRVTLTGLTPGQRYHFSVGTARKKLATGSFTMSASSSSSPPTKPDSSPAKSPSPERTSPVSKPAPTLAQKAPPARVTWGTTTARSRITSSATGQTSIRATPRTTPGRPGSSASAPTPLACR